MFPMFVVDLLHEVEIGVWRSLFIHLLRILHCGDGLLHELDRRYNLLPSPISNIIVDNSWTRYRAIPTFGRDTIRKFANNSSEMKQLAARDFEDLLQVCLYPYTLCYIMHSQPHISAWNSVLFQSLMAYF